MHGSAPDIAGKNIANPIGMIWTAAMMLDFIGRGEGRTREAHDAILAAITQVIKDGPRTGDLGEREHDRSRSGDCRRGQRGLSDRMTPVARARCST